MAFPEASEKTGFSAGKGRDPTVIAFGPHPAIRSRPRDQRREG